jgi:hypothetical protein
MSWYYVEKEYYDYAEDIEGVNIHYVCTPIGGVPDWDNQRATRYMPFVQSTTELREQVSAGSIASGSSSSKLRKKLLKLPQHVLDPQTESLTNSYLLHYYFEVFQDGHRRYSPLYSEEITTTAGDLSDNGNVAEQPTVSDAAATASIAVKEPST